MISYADLPTLNALLNTASAILSITGYARIRRGNRNQHRAFMIAALTTSASFLISYLVYHAHAGSVRFQGQGWMRTLYFTILISHTVLAVFVLPLVIITLMWALRGKFDRHRRAARWAFPAWLYVSVTGVIVYLMLYRL